MGEISDIMEIIRSGPKAAKAVSDVFDFRGKSITKGAKDATFQFPCLVSDSTPIDMADTTRQMLDKTYAAFTQTWISMNQMFDITIDPTPISYLKKLHQNLSLENAEDRDIDVDKFEVFESDDMTRYLNKTYDGSVMLYMNESKDFGVIFNTKNEEVRHLYESNKDLLREYMSDFDLTPLQPITEADDDPSSFNSFANAVVSGVNKQAEDNERMKRLDATKFNIKMAPQLTNRDIKRSNEMIPYGLEVRLLAVNDKKQFVQYIDIVIGIKTILHPVKSQDMVENLARALQNRSLLFKGLKWTTGEISFIKDILLNINDLKQDAIARSNGRSPYFGALKRLKEKKVGLRNVTVPTAVIPNSTIVVTTYEVDMLKEKYSIDLNDASTVKKLIDSLFLIGFIILDEGANMMNIMYDSSSDFEHYSMDALARENMYAATKNALGKEIGRMIAR